MTPDMINGSFEFLAAFFLMFHIRRVFKDKEVKGASIVATTFFTAWGFWNLFYYPHLGQWFSFYGGLAIVSMNFLWLYGMWRYR